MNKNSSKQLAEDAKKANNGNGHHKQAKTTREETAGENENRQGERGRQHIRTMNFEQYAGEANHFINMVAEELYTHRDQAARITRAVLHAVRDRIPPDDAVQFAQGLPMALKAVYFDQYDVSRTPVILRKVDEFLDYISYKNRFAAVEDFRHPNDIVHGLQAVFRVLEQTMDYGQINQIKNILPRNIAELIDAPGPSGNRKKESRERAQRQEGEEDYRYQREPQQGRSRDMHFWNWPEEYHEDFYRNEGRPQGYESRPSRDRGRVTSLHFDRYLNDAYRFINEVADELKTDRDQAFRVLRAVLHAVRDRIPADDATQFGQALPMVLKGVYFDQYDMSDSPVVIREKEEFIDFIREKNNIAAREDFREDEDVIQGSRAVFRVLERNLDEGQVNQVKELLNTEIRELIEPDEL